MELFLQMSILLDQTAADHILVLKWRYFLQLFLEPCHLGSIDLYILIHDKHDKALMKTVDNFQKILKTLPGIAAISRENAISEKVIQTITSTITDICNRQNKIALEIKIDA